MTHCLLSQSYIRKIEREGGPGMVQLGGQCRTALSRAGFNVPPMQYDNERGKQASTDPTRWAQVSCQALHHHSNLVMSINKACHASQIMQGLH